MHHAHIQDSTYHSLCYTSCGALAGMRNRPVPMGPPRGIDLVTLHTMSRYSTLEIYPDPSVLESGKEGRRDAFYLMTHSTHFIYGYSALVIYGIRHIMVVDNLDNKR